MPRKRHERTFFKRSSNDISNLFWDAYNNPQQYPAIFDADNYLNMGKLVKLASAQDPANSELASGVVQLNLFNKEVTGIRFSAGATFTDSNFQNALIKDSVGVRFAMVRGSLEGATFSNCTFSSADYSASFSIVGTACNNLKITNITLGQFAFNTPMQSVTFESSKLSGGYFLSLEGCQFPGSLLKDITIWEGSTHTNFTGATLRGAISFHHSSAGWTGPSSVEDVWREVDAQGAQFTFQQLVQLQCNVSCFQGSNFAKGEIDLYSLLTSNGLVCLPSEYFRSQGANITDTGIGWSTDSCQYTPVLPPPQLAISKNHSAVIAGGTAGGFVALSVFLGVLAWRHHKAIKQWYAARNNINKIFKLDHVRAVAIFTAYLQANKNQAPADVFRMRDSIWCILCLHDQSLFPERNERIALEVSGLRVHGERLSKLRYKKLIKDYAYISETAEKNCQTPPAVSRSWFNFWSSAEVPQENLPLLEQGIAKEALAQDALKNCLMSY